MDGVLARPAFSVDGRPYTWADVVAAARAWGDWARLEHDAARVAAGRHSAPDADDVRAAGDRFRSERRLYSADDFEAWLSRWGLGLDDWQAYIGGDRADVDDRVVWTYAVCSGELENVAGRLAARLAVYAAEREAPSIDRLSDVDETFDRFRERAATAAEIDSSIDQHRLEWTQLDCLWLESANSDVSNEVALAVREDGRTLEDVAAEAGIAAESRSLVLEDVDPELAPHVLGARAGELVGPVPHGDGFTLLLVVARNEPSGDDARVRQRAERHLTERAVEREVVRRVRWA